MDREKTKPTENARNADVGRKDKGDKDRNKFDTAKGDDYQVPATADGASRDAVKEDRG